MILPIHDRVREGLQAALQRLYQLPSDALPQLPIEYPPKRELGDLATPVAFELARRLRKAPRVLALELAAAIGAIDGVARVEAAPNGYLNIYLNRVAFTRQQLAPIDAGRAPIDDRRTKTIVEHTAINPNKAAHIGHLRNSALGDTLVRVQRFRGVPVEVQNYIDDTGVQVADVVVGFRELEGKSLDDIRHIADTTRFDYYCWDLYARVTQWYDADKEHLKIRAATLHDIEHGGTVASAMAQFIADRIVRCHLLTMARLNVDYDLLTWEGHILRLQFWARAFEILREKGAVYLQNEGKLAGCWVMRIEETSRPPMPAPNQRRTPAKIGKRSSFDRMAPSRTSAKTSPINSGSWVCSAAISTTGGSPPEPMAALCGRHLKRRETGRTPPSAAPQPPTMSLTCGRRTCRNS
jgi:arginyl-tRNA synthetase